MKNYSNFKNKLLKDKEVRKKYNALEPKFAIVGAVIAKRTEQGSTISLDLA